MYSIVFVSGWEEGIGLTTICPIYALICRYLDGEVEGRERQSDHCFSSVDTESLRGRFDHGDVSPVGNGDITSWRNKLNVDIYRKIVS